MPLNHTPKYIELTQEQVAIVCAHDYDRVFSCSPWHTRWDKSIQSYYAKRTSKTVNHKQTTILMHRFITDAPNGLYVDHFNHDTLDNRCTNITTTTPSDNSKNRRARTDNTSGVVGVMRTTVHGNMYWVAKITIGRKRTTLGYYKVFEDAVFARKTAEKKYGYIMPLG